MNNDNFFLLNQTSNIVTACSQFMFNLGAFVFYPLIILIVLTDVVLRYFLNSPLPWGVELSGLLLIGAFFGPAPQCEEVKANIYLDFLYNTFSIRGKHLVDILGQFIGLFWIGMLSVRTFMEVPDMISMGETGIQFEYPLWPLRFFLGLVTSILALRLVLNIFIIMGKIKKGA